MTASPLPDTEPVAWRYRHSFNKELWVVVAGPDWPERDPDMEPLYSQAALTAANTRADAAQAEVERVTRERGFDMRAHLARQREWSERTFGPGDRSKGVVDHIRKELLEIEAEPTDLKEWIDVAILALDGAWRAGYSPDQIIAQIVGTQERNEARRWPDWRTMPTDKAIEHDRTAVAALSPQEPGGQK